MESTGPHKRSQRILRLFWALSLTFCATASSAAVDCPPLLNARGKPYQRTAKLSIDQIELGIAALKAEGLSLKTEVMKGSKDELYTRILTAALGFEVTPAKLHSSSRYYDRSWTEWTKNHPATERLNLDKAPPLSKVQIIEAIVRLELNGFRTTQYEILKFDPGEETMKIIEQATGYQFKPSQLFNILEARGESWQQYKETASVCIELLRNQNIRVTAPNFQLHFNEVCLDLVK